MIHPKSQIGGTFLIALVIAVPLRSQEPASAPVAQPTSVQPADQTPTTNESAAVDPLRLAELLALIEGQNSPQARRTGARELLRLGWPEATSRLTGILRNGDGAAKAAVAGALADLPLTITPEYLDPLIAMLADASVDVRGAAAAALAASPPESVLPILRKLVFDSQQPQLVRLAAIETLGMMTERAAVALLVEVLHTDDARLKSAALAAIESAAARDFAGDPQAAFDWWESAQSTPAARWQDMQIGRLLLQQRSAQQTLQNLEQRLTAALRENYTRSLDPQRKALLDAYLTDPYAAVRQLGLTLVQSHLTEGKPLPDDTISRTRDLLGAPEPALRAAAVRTVATLRNVTDEQRFLDMLAREHHADVRGALVNGLGYVGSQEAVEPLLNVFAQTDAGIASEAITALGRLAERGLLSDPEIHERASTALLERYAATPADQFALRERMLWAMSRIGNPRFGRFFTSALDSHESPEVRLAAVRGIAALADPRTMRANGTPPPENAVAAQDTAPLPPGDLIDALVPVARDPDPAVRRAAVDAIANLGSGDAQVQALWNLLTPEAEPEEAIRVIAWRGAMRMLATRPLASIETWLARLPGDEPVRRQRTLELLHAAENQHSGNAERRDVLGVIRARLATALADAGQIDDAIALYVLAIDDLHAANSATLAQTAVDVLQLALRADRYDAQLAAALASENPGLDPGALWDAIASHIEADLTPGGVDQALRMLVQFQAHPPGSMPADRQQALEQMIARARQVQREVDQARVMAALQTLDANPEDNGARTAIGALDTRALPALRAALLDALQAEQRDAARIQRLHDLAKEISPEWAGFAADASAEDKRKMVEMLPG